MITMERQKRNPSQLLKRVNDHPTLSPTEALIIKMSGRKVRHL